MNSGSSSPVVLHDCGDQPVPVNLL